MKHDPWPQQVAIITGDKGWSTGCSGTVIVTSAPNLEGSGYRTGGVIIVMGTPVEYHEDTV